jgi:xylan 1,4-beta-xylosidase
MTDTRPDRVTELAQRQWTRMMGAGGAQDRTGESATIADLPAPENAAVQGGRGQVTISWDPVPGAIGYAVHRASTPRGPFEVVDHGGGDVLAVPHGPYADTTVVPGREYWYAVAPLATVNSIGPLSRPVPGSSTSDGPGTVELIVDAGAEGTPLHRPWRAMVGSEHLSHLLCPDRSGGRVIGTELRAALSRVRDELGVRSVRAHGILCDDLGVVKGGRFDFGEVDRVYDIVCELGMRPVVELSYMPRELARDPSRTVFAYQGIISPPKDWDRWRELVEAFTAHLVERYGRREVVEHWPIEVWNEANLSVFWSGTPREYWRLYEVSARAVKAVDPRIRVGGPASAAVGWLDDQLKVDAPVDFLSTHVYGSPPLDLRPLAAVPALWTEWGVTATHGSGINDTVFAAGFLLRGMRSAAGRVEALAPWVASDHFEELGRPPRLLHGGFGLLTVGNLAKPKFWALALAQRLGDTEIPVTARGDGAGSLVECWATRGGDGTIGLLLWNTTLDHSRAGGDPALDRRVTLLLKGLPAKGYRLTRWRVDAEHGNVAATWNKIGGGDWPDEEQWRRLAEADNLVPVERNRAVAADGGTLEIPLELPMPSISYVELSV